MMRIGGVNLAYTENTQNVCLISEKTKLVDNTLDEIVHILIICGMKFNI